MSITTLADATAYTGLDVLDHLDRDADIPVVADAPAMQGDVAVIPAPTAPPATVPMPESVAVVRGENGGNTHSLHPVGGACSWQAHAATSPVDMSLGVLTVPEGSQALLLHPEHGALLIDPGTYEIRRQREYAGEWAYVAD